MDWSITEIGRGVHLFEWPQGFYYSPIVVGSQAVAVVDPISIAASKAMRMALRALGIDSPDTIVYSHDHRDHIVGGASLNPHAQVFAHREATTQMVRRGDADILVPTDDFLESTVVDLGGTRIEMQYLGPSHSRSLSTIVIDDGAARHLYHCDVLDPGFAPYRNLPDTDIRGVFSSLDALKSDLDFNTIIGAHSGFFSSPEWADEIRDYFRELLAETERQWQQLGGQKPKEDEDGIDMTERVRGDLCRNVADSLHPTWGHLLGFDRWAPQNVDRIISLLITGN